MQERSLSDRSLQERGLEERAGAETHPPPQPPFSTSAETCLFLCSFGI